MLGVLNGGMEWFHVLTNYFNLETAVGSQKSAQALGALRSLSQIRRIYCGCAGFGQIFRSFSLNSHHYSPQTIEISDSNQTTLVTIANLGQAPHKIKKCLITTEGSRKNTFPCLGAETLVWQGARTAHTPRYGKDEQRRQAGWIDAQTGEGILARTFVIQLLFLGS